MESTMEAAKHIQAERERDDLQNHNERVEWLSADAPRWSCGTMVDAHSRNVLLLQSRAALAAAGAA
jgi:hypothetical protein